MALRPNTTPTRPADDRAYGARASVVGPAARALLTLALLALPSSAAPSARAALEQYDFARPALNVTLPTLLQEVSGLTDLSASEVLCVQDELGIVFLYDLARRAVTRQVRFGPPGDYEGITRVDSRVFVLRSDGLLYEIEDLLGRPAIRTYRLALPTTDNEGLCFDATRRRLLIAPKSRLGKGRDLRDVRPLYAFDLRRLALEPEPVAVLDVEDIREYALEHQQVLPEKREKKGGARRPLLRFMPSSLAVHPVTDEILVLSAMDHVLAAFDRSGKVTGYALLDTRLFRQPEGLTVLPNGDLVITNEAAGRTPTLLRLRWQGRPAPCGRLVRGSQPGSGGLRGAGPPHQSGARIHFGRRV